MLQSLEHMVTCSCSSFCGSAGFLGSLRDVEMGWEKAQALPKMGWGAVVPSKQPLLQNPALTAVAKANQVLIHHILLYQALPASSEIPPEKEKEEKRNKK